MVLRRFEVLDHAREVPPSMEQRLHGGCDRWREVDGQGRSPGLVEGHQRRCCIAGLLRMDREGARRVRHPPPGPPDDVKNDAGEQQQDGYDDF